MRSPSIMLILYSSASYTLLNSVKREILYFYTYNFLLNLVIERFQVVSSAVADDSMDKCTRFHADPER